eukprot:5234316-Pleurochrysis_carterae.AAC.14
MIGSELATARCKSAQVCRALRLLHAYARAAFNTSFVLRWRGAVSSSGSNTSTLLKALSIADTTSRARPPFRTSA